LIYRRLDGDGDMTFGHGAADFLTDQFATAQSVMTRLRLWAGEWFLDVNEGTPYSTQILGAGTKPLYDNAIQQRILGTAGVKKIVSYNSQQDPVTRRLTITAVISTIFGTTALPPVVI
jgi:hypothetical protein